MQAMSPAELGPFSPSGRFNNGRRACLAQTQPTPMAKLTLLRPGTSGSDATPAAPSNVDLSGEWYTELPPPKKARLQLQQRQIYLYERALDKQDLIILKLDTLNQHRDMAVAFMQRRMIIDGFHPTSNMWTLCALHVLGKDSLVDAKKDMSKYLAAQAATSNFKSDTNKKTEMSVYDLCVGPDRVYQFIGDEYVWNSEVGLELSEGDQYRNGGDDFGAFFKVESVRMIIYATWSLTKSELIQLGQPEKPHDNICHLTAHQIAFADCKVYPCLNA
ncbi:TPA: hypothetical protein ACH3X1_001352 [Trebouxia sp. C0004]